MLKHFVTNSLRNLAILSLFAAIVAAFVAPGSAAAATNRYGEEASQGPCYATYIYVVDSATGKMVTDAKVVAYDNYGRYNEATYDASSNAYVACLTQGTYKIDVVANGYTTQPTKMTVESNQM